jgi:hypothetical protein
VRVGKGFLSFGDAFIISSRAPMLEHHEDDPTQNLLDEELTKDELSEVLRRLGRWELGGSESSTIRDVAEATSADPQAIGRLLADIRKENFEEKYGLKIEEHEERIERLENKREPFTFTSPFPPYSYRPRSQESPAERIIARHRDILSQFENGERDALLNKAEDRRISEAVKVLLIVGAILIVSVCLVFALLSA